MSWIADKLKLVCTSCGTRYPWGFSVQCAPCGQALVDVEYNLARAQIRDAGPVMERYFDLLPVLDRAEILDFGEGNTPCPHAKELGKALGLTRLYLKNETAQPTGSTKARQASVAIAALRSVGIKHFVTSSTGNSSTALARMVSRLPDMTMHVFVGDEFLKRCNWPSAPNVKVYWLRSGTFVDAHECAKWFAADSGITSMRGFFFFGQREALKTAYFEAVDQIPHPIDHYVQSISSGLGLHATYRGAQQLLGMGRIERIPAMIAVQEETCNPMVRGWERGAARLEERDVFRFPRGLSKSTLRGDPSLAYPYIRAAVKDSGGTFVTARQEDMRSLRRLLKETEGIDACFTSTMTVAAARDLRAAGRMAADATVMLNVTGADRTGEPGVIPDHTVEKTSDGWHITRFDPADSEGCLDRVLRVLGESIPRAARGSLDTETRLVEADLALTAGELAHFAAALAREFARPEVASDLDPRHFTTIGAIADHLRGLAVLP